MNVPFIAVLVLIALAVWGFLTVTYFSLRLFPEVGLVANSQCKKPLQGWDGKILNFQLWKNTLKDRPEPFYARLNTKETSFDRKLTTLQKRPVIFWGSHHKTGTYLAQKLFSKICSRMNWCCVFHVTRDSVHAVLDTMERERVDVVGHSQWVWFPEEFGVAYRFIHFYRNPLKKIGSGFRYHREGAESWTLREQGYNLSCEFGLSLLSSGTSSNISKRINLVNRSIVTDYCRSIRLCETCCRREHEVENVLGEYADDHVSVANVEDVRRQYMQRFSSRKFAVRSQKEYEFICKHLGQTSGSLRSRLNESPILEAYLTEASLDYFENLRMARIFNRTMNDPYSLNIDLDSFVESFESTVRKILAHIEIDLPRREIEELVQDLQFFDIKSSTLYRWSMSNALVNHLNAHSSSSGAAKDEPSLLLENEEFVSAYSDIFQLFQSKKENRAL